MNWLETTEAMAPRQAARIRGFGGPAGERKDAFERRGDRSYAARDMGRKTGRLPTEERDETLR